MRFVKRILVSFGAISAWLLLGSSVHLDKGATQEPVKDFLYSKYSQKYLTTKIHFTTFAFAGVNPRLIVKETIAPFTENNELAPYAFMSESAIHYVINMKQEAANAFQDTPLPTHKNDTLFGRVFEKPLLALNGRGVHFGYKRSMLYDEVEEPLEDLNIGHSQKGHSVFVKASLNFGATLLTDEKALQGTIKFFEEKEQQKFEAKATTPVQQATLTSPAQELEISASDYKRSEKCLADAIYFESRSEPERGQVAVAQVIVNRALSGYYPNNICGVVYQNAHRHLACQFTFACEGKKLIVTEKDHWSRATRIARDMLGGKLWLKDVANATHYHASYVSPYWAKSMKKHQKIGLHHFYRPREWN